MKTFSVKLLRPKALFHSLAWSAVLSLTCLPASLVAASDDIFDLSIEELMNIEVTSVSGKNQKLSDSAAAIFVITNEEIQRSGVTNLPDALRMVPGLNVSRNDSNKWAVNSRSANTRFANKLLVLIDGRSIYSNTFSGVYWEVQDLMLEDVDRIEVIRGPGATLWGANAVNGVINIITRHTAETRGGFVEVGGGTEEHAFAGARYGFALGDSTDARLYAKGFHRDEFEYVGGGDAGDDWDMLRSGFRLDSSIAPENSLTLQGDIYRGDIHQNMLLLSLSPPYYLPTADKTKVSGGNLTGNWHKIFSPSSELTVHGYYDQNTRKEAYATEARKTFDLGVKYRWRGTTAHDIIMGAGYRYTKDDFATSENITLTPDHRSDKLVSCFVQDEITLIESLLWFTLGSKLEYNDYSDYEVQPSARLLWAPTRSQRVWTSVSRAVRTPNRVETDAVLITAVSPPSAETSGMPVAVTLGSNHTFDSEFLLAYEVGYRITPASNFSVDLAAYYNDYDHLRRTREEQPVFHGTYMEFPLTFINTGSARTFGFELASTYKPTEWLQFDLAYGFMDSDDSFEGDEPTHLLSLRSAFQVRDDLTLDIWLRYADETRSVYVASAIGYYTIDSYVTCDVRLAWQPTEKLEIALVGQNLIEENHLEFVQEKFTAPTTVPRGFYGKLSYRF